MDELEAYYFPITITGTALVYAKTREAARELLKVSGVMVAGNKMREHEIVINDIEYNDEVSKLIWTGFRVPPQEKEE